MKKGLFMLALFAILGLIIISGCEKYTPAPSVLITWWDPPLEFYVVSDTAKAFFTFTEVDFRITNGVDADMDYITVDYYANGSLVASDNVYQDCAMYMPAYDSEGALVTSQLFNYPVDVTMGVKELYANSDLHTILARITFHGHAHYNEDLTFTVSCDVELIKAD